MEIFIIAINMITRYVLKIKHLIHVYSSMSFS